METSQIITDRDRRADLTIKYAFAELLEKDERIASLEADITTYRELVTASIHFGHELTAANRRLQRENSHLREQLRAEVAPSCNLQDRPAA